MLLHSDWISYTTGEYKDADARYGNPSPYFRKSFSISKEVSSAKIYISALGVFKVYINGAEVGEDFLSPGWVDYSKKLPLIEYDITEKIYEKNAVGIVLGDGWAVGHIGSNYTFKRCCWSDRIEFTAEIRIQYADGSDEIVGTDSSWKASTGEILRSDIYMGEYVDARLSLGNFSMPDYDDSEWDFAEVPQFKFSRNLYLWHMPIPPVVVKERFIPQKISETGNCMLYDVGQNIAGVIKCRVKGERGAKIIVRHGEILNDGKLYTDNLRKAEATDTYILSGDGEEIFRPLFTYHGFQFFDIEIVGEVEIVDVMAEAMYTDLLRSGSFECSDAMVNKLFGNALWSMADNLYSVPTDCPQRDERLGWLGDAQIISRSAMYNFDCEKYFAKYLSDICDAQFGNGAIPAVAPLPRVGYYTYSGREVCGGWSEAIGEITYNHYRMYGNKQVIRDNLPCLKRLLVYYKTDSNGYLREGGNSYGDWLCVGEACDKGLVASIYYARAAYIAYKLCEIIKDDDLDKYLELYNCIRDSIRQRYLDENLRLLSDTQTAYVLSFKTGIIDAEEARKNLKRKLTEDNMHLTCGFLGIRFLLPTLCDIGMVDEAYEILCQRTYPGWGYSVEQGATTIWEHWDSNSVDNLKGMNSFNHYSLGSCVEWMYEYCLGIRADTEMAGFQKVIIKPCICCSGKIISAKGEYNTKYGKIEAEWTMEKDYCRYRVKIPKEIEAEYVIEVMDILEKTSNGETTEFVLKLK